MKYIAAFILLFTLVHSCKPTGINEAEKRNQNWSWFVDNVTGEGKWVPVGDQTNLPDGDYTLFFSNGSIRQTGKIKDKRDYDTISYYNLDGKVIVKAIMLPDSSLKKFVSDGKYKSYYPTCELASEGEYKNNEPIGPRIAYYKNGKIKTRITVSGDSAFIMNYFESGARRDSSMTVNNKYEGESKVWFENGNLDKYKHFRNDLEDSTSFYYYESGILKGKINYKYGIANGYTVAYYENASRKSEMTLSNGVPDGLLVTYYENGQIEKKANYSNKELNGEYLLYYPNGKVKQSALVKDGIFISYKNYNEAGNLTDELKE